MAGDLLIVDDELDNRELIAEVLSDEGYAPRTAADSTQTLAALAARRPQLVLLDIWLQGSKMDGLELLDHIKAQHPDLPVVMISGHGNIETAVSAIKRGAYDFIEKPFETDRLLLVIQRAIEAAKLTRENAELRQRVGRDSEMVGGSSGLGQVANAIERVARTGSRVLISGPAGVGKEIAARRLHSLSSRDDGPFVVINAATMAPNLVEIELFGIEEGALGNEGNRRIGVFEQAHGGTLLLDEVADMPYETQGKILRVLVDQTFQRVGGGTDVQVDVRVVSASSRDLRVEIDAGRFREDLYHRLSVVPIRIPPLRERRDDIAPLVEHFMARSSQVLGLPARQIGDDALAILQGYDWPGNVRQLRNIVERLLIMAPGDAGEVIGADMLPPEITMATPPALQGDAAGQVMTLPLREAREVFEREYLAAQINRFGGNISRTAEFVGMERSALHRKLKSLGLNTRFAGGG
ncbi:MAG: sigma-54 dependent transcriptional regulator [Alphaproteobacteria bacterium]